MSFGTGPFGYFDAGGAYAVPEGEERGALSSSRKINTRGQYEVATDTGLTGMDDVAQTVLLTVAYASKRPKFITPETLEAERSNISTALQTLQKTQRGVIELKSVVVTGEAGTMKRAITYRNLRTGETRTVVQS